MMLKVEWTEQQSEHCLLNSSRMCFFTNDAQHQAQHSRSTAVVASVRCWQSSLGTGTLCKVLQLTSAMPLMHRSFTVKHLDDRVIKVTSNAGEVIKPNSFKVVPEEGMPVHTRPFIKGNLYIKFEVGVCS